ncbi:sulfide:quinone oxidoreductase, mitochondrial isoform X2 [Prorops nasuta]|uniref:sulfide:quinone oxidoreductase, mitochondrial isoform X2 n=1 Tax=Prorops nasuta TaxID=863751 RepID=UPI0034CEC99E
MLRITSPSITLLSSSIFKSYSRNVHYSVRILVLGGGTAGISVASKFVRRFKNDVSDHEVLIIEPSDVHYYQPLFTLIGGGIKRIESSKKLMKEVIPKGAGWLKDSVTEIKPKISQVVTSRGVLVQYKHLIVAMGLQLNWDKIPGLKKGLEDPDAQVCSIYGPETVPKVFNKIKKTKDGNTIFTFPNSPVKCPGAPQKIMYLAEDYFQRNGLRQNINVIYNTALPVIFGVKKYADSLWSVCEGRNISVNLQSNLIGINPEKREATFEKLGGSNKMDTVKYSLLHVTPPMGPPDVLKNHPDLVDKAGFLSVDPESLRHSNYINIFGLGDCTNSPNSKTMAAVAAQADVVYNNIMYHMYEVGEFKRYNGYASCPLVTGYGKCILAEFDYNLEPLETFPIDQGKEYYFTYLLKVYFFPFLYWNFMLQGKWDGPTFFRQKVFRYLKKKKNSEKDR